MKTIRFLLLFAALMMLATGVIGQSGEAEANKSTYVCPMNCAGSEAHEPGNCPVCNMALVKKVDDEKEISEQGYACPPCGHDCLKTVFAEAGACGECGMALVKLSSLRTNTSNSSAPRNEDRLKVAILIFDNVQIIDYTGPYEVFGGAGFEVFTVAKNAETITTVYGMSVTPNHTFDNTPEPNIVLVPGGGVFQTQRDPVVQGWLRATAKQADHILSVCNGAYILAKTGLLNGLSATSTRHLTAGLANAAPNINVVHNVRWVDNGKIVTAGGLSAGIDAALHVVAKIQGVERAERLAFGLEYAWQKTAIMQPEGSN